MVMVFGNLQRKKIGYSQAQYVLVLHFDLCFMTKYLSSLKYIGTNLAEHAFPTPLIIVSNENIQSKCSENQQTGKIS